MLKKLSWITLIAVYLLILVGGIVRSTGSGMGCPDWPKCFGQWVPPTSVNELPDDYKDVYSRKRQDKNVKLAGYMEKLGFEDLAFKLRHDEAILQEADFNATKTWIEYINRLIGVLIGFLILATFISSLKYWKSDKKLVLTSFSVLVLVIIQAWIGSVVVSTNLLPWTITVHMLLAMVIVALLILIVHWSGRIADFDNWQNLRLTRMLLVTGMVFMVVQILLGTQIREMVDIVMSELGRSRRGEWVEALGLNFVIHRSFSIAILLVHVALIYYLFKSRTGFLRPIGLPQWLLVVIIITIGSGAIMGHFGIPAFAQPIHLLFAVLTFGLQFMLWLQLRKAKQIN